MMLKYIAIVALMALASTAHAQSYRQAHEQLFCNILGGYAADGAADLYNHVSLDQSLRRVDGFICTDRNRKVCEIKVEMVRDAVRHWYGFAQQRGYDKIDAATFNTLADAIKTNATSACWRGAKEHYGW